MERDYPRSFNPAVHIDYQRLQVKPNGMVNPDPNTDVESLHVNRKDSVPANTILDQDLRDTARPVPPSTADPNVPATPNNSFHPIRHSRLLSYITTPKDKSTHPANESNVRPAGKAQGNPPFGMITFVNVSVSPDSEHYHDERGRTLRSMAYAPQQAPVSEVGGPSPGVGAVLSAMNGIGPQHPSMQRLPPSTGGNQPVDPYPTSAPGAPRQLDHLALPPGSSILSVNPDRYAVAPPAYQGPFDTAAFRDPALRQGVPPPTIQRQALHLQSQAQGHLQDIQARKVHMSGQPDQLQQQLHLQGMRQMGQHQDGQVQQYGIEHQHQGRVDVQRQQMYYPPRCRSQQYTATRMRQFMGNERGMNPSAEKFSAKGGRGRSRANHRTDSVPATPTTAATSSPAPFPTAPSSPDNNGSSSNGSGQREHPCTYPGCTKSFDRRYNLTVHYRRHTDEMPYPCKVEGCTQRFKWRSSQSHHLKTRHQMFSVGKGSKISKNSNAPNQSSSSKAAGQSLTNVSGQGLRYQRTFRGNDGFAKTVSSQRGPPREEGQGASGSQGGEEGTFSPKKKARVPNGN